MNDKIVLEHRTKETPFNSWNKINRAKVTFNDDAKIKRDGKLISLQEYTNKNNVDCTIYDVYNTYRGDLKLTKEKLNVLHNKIADEMVEINNLHSALQVMKQTEKVWKEMPLEIKKEFNNDVQHFQKNGLKWANTKIKAYNDELARIKATAKNADKVTQTTEVK